MPHSIDVESRDAPGAALARCAQWITDDAQVSATLAAIQSPDEFRDALLAAVAAHGDAHDAVALAGLRFDRAAPAARRVDHWPLAARRGWQPLALEWGVDGAELAWGLGIARDDLPFHETRVAQLRYRPFNRWFALRTPLTPSFVAALEADMLPLSGLILHMSRCGSTLITQTLKAWPGTRVLSEPGMLDIALTAALAGADPHWLSFRGVLAALRQPAGSDRDVVIKLDAWHALALAPLQAQLPDVPWLFVYRDPLEVLASHAKEPGRHTVPGMLPETWLGGPLPAGQPLAPIEYAARVLGVICAAVLPHASADQLVNYSELVSRDGDAPPTALTRRIPRWFGLDPQAIDRARLDATLLQHAKRPHESYSDDRAAKRNAATNALRDAADRWIAPHYAALEAIRRDSR
jgi:hypothetical protein